jgi:hypothetical protein
MKGICNRCGKEASSSIDFMKQGYCLCAHCIEVIRNRFEKFMAGG